MKLCVGKDKGILTLSVVLGAVSAVAAAFVSIILQRIVDVAVKGDVDGFSKLIIGIAVYMVALCLIGFAEALCGKVLLRNVTRNLRDRIFQGVMGKTPEEYYRSNSADYLSMIVNDVKLIEENFLVPLLLSVQMVALFLATLAILCYLSPLITVILIFFLLLMFLVPALLGKALQKRQEAYSEKLAVFTAKAKDFLSGYEVIRGFSIGGHILKKFRRENRQTANGKFRADRLVAINESLADMLSTLSIVVVVFVAAYMVLKGRITAGTLLALIQLSGTFSTPVLVIMQNFPKMTGMKPILKKLEQLCAEEPKTGPDKEPENEEAISFDRGLELESVKYGYEEGNDVLRGVDLQIEPKKKYAFLGDSGCGKTTLTKLMTGYSNRYEGSIRYDGREVREMNGRQLSSLISVIHQNVYLFDTDIYQNICLDESFSEEELRRALDRSGVAGFLDQLDDGIHTRVGENGNRLSGGQRQRVAVARALIRRTPILILDEGTSAVDQKTACAIERQLLEEKDLTLITITHHMQEELRERYDRIVDFSA
ncbi:ABC transporter ATP-binding protein/permease [Anaerovorax odorimutans]|uniref:ABC transporter ATP-binding protein/permease n=1 Tax=Anaerovorax odorimutans TaxID=109327 RepID=A0ABT1RP32_9FIRM|nr:ABC transporter ATP-binding protein [Anaerovorax odorimutans]MCQ4636931.1 ABC transporter ATP-binding protein/permease [Anaerovorax odorimutans]